MNSPAYIIAEVGVNHNGDQKLAHSMIEAARAAGAHCVKFQTFFANRGVTRVAPKAPYQYHYNTGTESQLSMLQKIELPPSAFLALKRHAEQSGIDFLSSPFDCESIDLLHSIGCHHFKIPSGEITNLPYLSKLGSLDTHIFLSTGMSELDEIERAITSLVNAGTNREKITLLQCTSSYPAPVEDVNLRAMATLQQRFSLRIGYSDHTLGVEVPIAAVALGAKVIEKHFTLSRDMPGPDHRASLVPDEFSSMVRAIRLVERALGDGIKRVMPSEEQNKKIARKSIVAIRQILTGEYFTEQNIIPKRPGTGMSAALWESVIGTRASRSYLPDELIREEL